MPVLRAVARVEAMTEVHAAAVLAIYQAGMDEGNATFEARAPGWEAFTAAHLPAHRFVSAAAGQVTGWVAASAVSGRCVYAGVVEHSVYVHPAARGQGTGRRLLAALITSTEAAEDGHVRVAFVPQFMDRGLGCVPLQFAILGAIFVAFEVLVDGTVGLTAGRPGTWLPRRRRAAGCRRRLRNGHGCAGRLVLER